jgi:hypothetical protein
MEGDESCKQQSTLRVAQAECCFPSDRSNGNIWGMHCTISIVEDKDLLLLPFDIQLLMRPYMEQPFVSFKEGYFKEPVLSRPIGRYRNADA